MRVALTVCEEDWDEREVFLCNQLLWQDVEESLWKVDNHRHHGPVPCQGDHRLLDCGRGGVGVSGTAAKPMYTSL